MLFSFTYHPFTAIIGDIKNSRDLENRRDVQSQLQKSLNTVNDQYKDELASKFMITLGDEFQGLLKTAAPALYIIDQIEREMYPVKIRFGVGVGAIVTDINSNMPLGADGPAYYSARKMVDELRLSEKKRMEPIANVKIEIQNHDEAADLMNTIFSLLTTLKETWTSRQTEIISAYLKYKTQKDAAQFLNINQSNVQKALSSANFYTCQKAMESVFKILSGIKGDAGV